jgi:hypothetical protein
VTAPPTETAPPHEPGDAQPIEAPVVIDWKSVITRSVGLGAAVAAGLFIWLKLSGDKPWTIAISVGGFFYMAGASLARRVLTLKGHHGARKAVSFALAAAVAGTGLYFQTKTAARVLNLEEKVDLAAVGEGPARRLRHAYIGFSIRDPGPDLPLIGTKMQGETAILRAYRNNDKGQVLTIGIFKDTGSPEAFVRGLLEGMTKKPPEGAPAHVVEVDKLDVTGGPRPEGRLVGRLDGHSYRVNAHGFEQNGSTYAVMLGVASAEPDALEDVLTSFARP